MKILLVLESAGGGVGRHSVDLATYLAKNGHKVGIVYSMKRVERRFLSELAGLDDCHLYPVKMARHPGLSDLAAVRALRSIIRGSIKWDIIHGHSSKGGALARIAGIGAGAKIVYTPHAFVTMNPNLGRASRIIYTSLERALATVSDAIVCVSQEEAAHASKNLKISAAKLFVVENGVDENLADRISRSEARSNLNLTVNDVCIGFVGRLCEQKSVHRLLNAFFAAHEIVPNLRLVVVGDGPDRQRLERMAAAGRNGSVHFTGTRPAYEVLPAFDVFAVSSLYEGHPYVLVEAARAGLPIVSTNVGGASAMIENEVSGFICNENDPVAEISSALVKLAENHELRTNMGAASRERSLTYTIDNMGKRTVEVYVAD